MTRKPIQEVISSKAMIFLSYNVRPCKLSYHVRLLHFCDLHHNCQVSLENIKSNQTSIERLLVHAPTLLILAIEYLQQSPKKHLCTIPKPLSNVVDNVQCQCFPSYRNSSHTYTSPHHYLTYFLLLHRFRIKPARVRLPSKK